MMCVVRLKWRAGASVDTAAGVVIAALLAQTAAAAAA
eukprot:gene10199-6467_t